ncbi:MAG: metallophosphoesterase [Bacteroidota bacterium]
MRIVLFILLLLGFDLVVYQSVQLAIHEWSSTAKLVAGAIFWTIPVLFICWYIFGQNQAQDKSKEGNYRLQRSIFQLIYLAKVVLLLASGLFLLIHPLLQTLHYFIPSIPVLTENTQLFAQIAVILALGLFFLMLYGILFNRHRYKIHRVSVNLPNLPSSFSGLKIVQISDIHSGSFTDKAPLKKGIDLINQEAADLVFFTGDLVNSIASEIEPYVEVFSRIQSKYGVFSGLGNHDYGDYVRWPNREIKEANLRRLMEIEKVMGWQLLMNENRLKNINGVSVAVIGVENYSGSPRFSKYGKLDEAYRGAEKADIKLLLSHDPSHWDAQIRPNFPDIDVTFSGHTHGAQFGIEIPKLFRWSPVQYAYKQWAGLYQAGKQYLYVNRGFGYLGYPGRVGILPEITVLNVASD